MKKVSDYLFIVLKNSFIISAVCLLLAWLGGDSSFFEMLFGIIGFYGAMLTILLFVIHVLSVILTFLFKKEDTNP